MLVVGIILVIGIIGTLVLRFQFPASRWHIPRRRLPAHC